MIYQFDRFTLDTEEYLLTRDSERLAPEPRVFDVLVYLLENRDRIVSKDELIEALWEGRIITDSALNTCIRSVRRTLSDDREKQAYIRTFPKRGFQFVGKLNPDTAHTAESGRKFFLPALALVVLGFVAVAGYKFLSLPDDSLASNRPSIAVLDFDHSASTDKQRYFTEGLVEELVFSLSRYRELFVISRNSSRLFSDGQFSPQEISRELGAEYIVDGQVRYDGDNIRVSAQLIDGNTGQQLWSTQINRPQGEIYTLQSELAFLVAGQLFPELVRVDSEKNRINPPEVLDAWALYHKARTKQAVYQKEMQGEAIHWAEMALIRDPNLAAAHGVIARAKGVQFFYGWSDDRQLTLEEAIASAKQAINMDSNDAGGYAALGYIYRYTGDETSALANLKRATMLNPGDANIRLEYAHTLDWFRHQEQGLSEIIQAIKLSPRDPRLENMLFYKAHMQFHLHQYEASLETTNLMSGALTSETWRMFYHLIRAANQAQLNQQQAAAQSVEAALRINPKLSISAMGKQFESSKNHPENRRFWLESLEMAGIPD